MKMLSALVGLLEGLLIAIVGASVYYITRFKTRGASFLTTVGASFVGMILMLVLSSLALRRIFPFDSGIKWYLIGFFFGGLILGIVVLGSILGAVRRKERYRTNDSKPSEKQWFDVPPPAA